MRQITQRLLVPLMCVGLIGASAACSRSSDKSAASTPETVTATTESGSAATSTAAVPSAAASTTSSVELTDSAAPNGGEASVKGSKSGPPAQKAPNRTKVKTPKAVSKKRSDCGTVSANLKPVYNKLNGMRDNINPAAAGQMVATLNSAAGTVSSTQGQVSDKQLKSRLGGLSGQLSGLASMIDQARKNPFKARPSKIYGAANSTQATASSIMSYCGR